MVEGDGDYEVWYEAEDYAGNIELPSYRFNVHVDGVDPDTRIVSIDGPTGSLMDCGCSGHACYPPRGCFSGNVTVTMEGTDGDSGVGFIEYYYPGMPAGLLGLTRFYDGPFEIPEPTDAPSLSLSYRSVDAGGNAELWKEATICFCSPWMPSFLGSRLTIDPPLEGTISWALLEERIPDPSDIQMVGAAYAVPGPGNPEWIVAAVDSEGKDGWRVSWDTAKLRDREYLAQLAVYGFPAKPGGQPLLLHSDSRSVMVCNLPAAQYHFTLDAPDEVPLGASIPFTIKFSHKFQGDVAAAVLTCDLDPKLFERIEVLDGGTLDKRGRPTWLRGKLARPASCGRRASGCSSTRTSRPGPFYRPGRF
ncbi:MAG: hypothetical protein ACUVYA_01375 [Planctomycetota bacterium]